MLRFLDAGESHGKALVAIIDGFPSNVAVDEDYVNRELERRQQGYGRGARMKMERDRVEFLTGLRGNMTTGNPITMIISNKDYENWKDILGKIPDEHEKIVVPRPGHGDMVGYFKYGTSDIRNAIERSSARETAIRSAVGALCKRTLEMLGIHIRSKVRNIGGTVDDCCDLFDEACYDRIEHSEVRCFGEEAEGNMKAVIDKCKEQGDTVGGSVFVSIRGVPLGVGSYVQWDRKLDAVLSGAVMSVQGIKAVEFGNVLSHEMLGSSFNDEMFIENGHIARASNNCGGIEAGVSNGQNIEFTAYMKPIPSVKKNMATVDLKKKINVTNRYERSDVCGVVPASIVLENVVAFEIMRQVCDKFPSDDFIELSRSLNDYRREIYEK